LRPRSGKNRRRRAEGGAVLVNGGFTIGPVRASRARKISTEQTVAKRFLITSLIAVVAAAPASAGPLITTGTGGNDGMSSSLDREWSVRARNFDNRGGTWKPIIFGGDGFSNNGNAVSSNANWNLTGGGTTVNGTFTISFNSPRADEKGSVNFRTSNHNITHNNVGTDSDSKDGSITDLKLYINGSADSLVTLSNLELIYGDGSRKVALPTIASGNSGAGQNAWMAIGNFNPKFAFGFSLTGSYSIIHDGNVGDEAPRWELQAYSGGSYQQEVAEPATLALLGAGFIGLALARRRKA
jgi:hypothetical protein